ncbi:hydrolase or metal-binding protein, partial [Psychrobacter sp. Cmf 22.2]
FEVDSDGLLDVVEEFYPIETDDISSNQQGSYQNGLAAHNVTSIEQGLRKSVTAVS